MACLCLCVASRQTVVAGKNRATQRSACKVWPRTCVQLSGGAYTTAHHHDAASVAVVLSPRPALCQPRSRDSRPSHSAPRAPAAHQDRAGDPDHHAVDGGLALVPVKAPSAHAGGVASALTGASIEPTTGNYVMVRERSVPSQHVGHIRTSRDHG